MLGDLVGQPAVVRTLANAIGYDKLSHAYLFTGPRGTGKTSTARILAKSLNCQKGPTETPCLECASCREIKLGTSPAVFEIDAASNNSVDDARVLIERAPLVAVGGRFKLYIIDECHMLTREAFNALLKTIEEPPPQVVFVLATTEEHKVPPTIVSRCQKLMFRLVSQEDLVGYLEKIAAQEKIEIDGEALRLIARRSGGGLRDALGLLDQASLLSAPGKPVAVNDLLIIMGALREDVLLDISRTILGRHGQDVLKAVNQLLAEGREPSVLAMELARHFLNLMKASYVVESGQPEAAGDLIIGSPDYIAGLCAQAPDFDRQELSQMVEQLNRLEQTCRRTTQPSLHLEIGLLALCHRHDMRLVGQLDERLSALEEALASGAQPAVRRETPRPAAQQAPPADKAHAPAESVEPAPQPAPSILEQAAGVAQAAAGLVQLTQEAWQHAADALAGVEQSLPEAESAPGVGQSAGPFEPAAAARTAGQGPEAYAAGDLEEFWSRLLDEVPPSIQGVLSNYPFPLALDQNELVIGVTNDMWKNHVEKRMEPIKAACNRVLGRNIAVKIKVVASAPSRKAGREPSGGSTLSGVASGQQDEAEEPEPAACSGNGGAPSREPARRPGSGGIPPAEPADDPQADGAARVMSGRAASTASERGQNGITSGSTTVREAYKLFEGPGSRLIS
jgi:DNA polymerase-3 subunit gamma/tau